MAIQKIKVAQGELQTCYAKNADGTENWENITKELPAASFSGVPIPWTQRQAAVSWC